MQVAGRNTVFDQPQLLSIPTTKPKKLFEEIQKKQDIRYQIIQPAPEIPLKRDPLHRFIVESEQLQLQEKKSAKGQGFYRVGPTDSNYQRDVQTYGKKRFGNHIAERSEIQTPNFMSVNQDIHLEKKANKLNTYFDSPNLKNIFNTNK